MTFYDPQADPPAEIEVLAAVIAATIDAAWVDTPWVDLSEEIKDSFRSAALGVYSSEYMRQAERQAAADELRKIANDDPKGGWAIAGLLRRRADQLEAENANTSLV